MKSKHLCPKCGGKEFITVAHISQDWKVDEYGNFVKVQEECLETIACPNDGNIWTCSNCGSEGIIIDSHDKSNLL